MVECTYANLDYIYKSLADPTRRDILDRLCQRQHTITELAENYHMTFAGVAKHIVVLEKAQLITKTKQGKEQYIDINANTFSHPSQHLAHYTDMLQRRYNRLEQLLQSQEK